MTMPDSAAVQIVTMYDSVNVGALPDGSRYMAYVNGAYANYGAVKARFPLARVYGIDVLGDAWEKARIADWERGNFGGQDPARLRTFAVERERYREHTTTIYCDRSDLPGVEDILDGVWHELIVSTLDGTDLTGQRTAKGNLIVGTQLRGGGSAPFDTSTTLASWR